MTSECAAKAIIEASGAVISQENTAQKTNGGRLVLKTAVVLLLIFCGVSVAAPFVNAARFSGRIQSALESFLGRPVKFDKVYYRVLPVPGFSLEKVTIGDDVRFGLEPFSYMEGLEARLRVDKLLRGEIRFASLRLIDPSLNLVKRDDGEWNVVELLTRLSTPRRAPLNLIPAIQISDGRFDFKMGVRKTTFYLTNTDLSLYPDLFGKVVFNFTASPARTDRAGNGFGLMRGTVKWLPNGASQTGNQLEADVTLEPSNLSELTTLIEGHDVGVHGTILSKARITGPLAALKVSGDLELKDVHRWDLLPSTGDDWKVPYEGTIDLASHRLNLHTVEHAGESAPAVVDFSVNNFATAPAWSLKTELNHAPIEALLPLARRMGLTLPAGLELTGGMDGALVFSNTSGALGEIFLHDAVAKAPGMTPISAQAARVKLAANEIHLDPVLLESKDGGELRVGGDFSMPDQRFHASINVSAAPVAKLKSTAEAWFGTPPALAALEDGMVSGDLRYDNATKSEQAGWSGQLQLTNASLNATGLQYPLRHAQGHVTFTQTTLDLPHFSGTIGERAVQGSYHYAHGGKHIERVHVEMAAATLKELAADLEPAWRDKGLLSRLPFTKREVPAWLAARSMEGDISIGKLALNEEAAGVFNARFMWQGASVQLSGIRLKLASGMVSGEGDVDLASRAPQTHLSLKAAGIRWAGGIVNLEGELDGGGADLLEGLQGKGTFAGTDLSLSPSDSFEEMSGTFQLTFADNWAKLLLTKVEGVKGNEQWSGAAASNKEGQLIFDLANGDKQLHIVSTLGTVGHEERERSVVDGSR